MSALLEQAELAARKNREMLAHLFQMVASTARRGLDPHDGELIGAWFDRLAAGEDPRTVFGTRRPGRPRGTTNPRAAMADGRTPEDIDVAYLVQQAIAVHGLKRPDAERGVAKAMGMPIGTVRNIYGRLKHEVEPLPQFARK